MQVPVEPCSDEFIKEMIVNVCGMVGLKRSFSDNGSYGSKLGLNFKGMLGDIEREFQHLVGDIEEADLLLKKLKNNPRGIYHDFPSQGANRINKCDLYNYFTIFHKSKIVLKT